MKPGDVFWYRFPEAEAGQRVIALPHMVVLVSREGLHYTVNACPISSASHYTKELAQQHPHLVALAAGRYAFLKNDSVVLADQIFCLTPQNLETSQPIGTLQADDLSELKGAIFDVLEMDT